MTQWGTNYVPTRSMCSADTGSSSFTAKLYWVKSTVRQSDSCVLNEASISQFFTRFSTSCGRLPAA